MAKLIYSAIGSLDGYTADQTGSFDWAVPGEEVHGFINDLERPVGTYLYGRRMYETMAPWETDASLAERSGASRDFAQIWRAADKIVYSRTLETASTARTRLEKDFDPEAVRQLKAAAESDLTVGGPNLAAQAFEARLIDEFQLFLAPSWWEAASGCFPTVPAWSSSCWPSAGSAMAWSTSTTEPQPDGTRLPHEQIEIETPTGPARAHLHPADEREGALVLGHGAGAGIDGPDLAAATEAGRDEGFSVALIEQPYRVAGRRSPAPAKRLDEAWIAVIEHLRANQLSGLPLIAGGRSLGARVACRTVERTGAIAVLCLAFPLLPPRRGDKPPQSRLPELEAVDVPVLVVQGESDRFGMPPAGPGRQVAKVRGDHGLKSDGEAIAAAIRAWLPTIRRG